MFGETTLSFDDLLGLFSADLSTEVDGAPHRSLECTRFWCERSGDSHLHNASRKFLLSQPEDRRSWDVGLLVDRCVVVSADGSEQPLGPIYAPLLELRTKRALAAGRKAPNPAFAPLTHEFLVLLGPDVTIRYLGAPDA